MATNLSTYLEQAILNAIRGGGNGTSFTAPTAIFVQLHTAAPGAAGTANVAGNSTREAASFGAASGSDPASISSSADVTWTNVSTSETYTDVSLWDASTVGNCIAVGSLTASKAVTAGDTFTITAGSLTVSLT